MKKNILNILIVTGLVLGVVGGFLVPSFMNSISFIGTIYVNLLKFLIGPVIFSSIAVNVYNARKNKEKLLVKTIVLFVVMFILTFLVTSLIVVLIKPGNGNTFAGSDWSGNLVDLNVKEIIVNFFPKDITSIFGSSSIFSCIIFAFVFGVVARKVSTAEKLISGITTLRDIFYQILNYVMYLTPLAVFSLIGVTTASSGGVIIGLGAKYIGMAYLCSVISFLLVMALPVWIYSKINPLRYIKKLLKVWLHSLTTCSSVATLPLTIKTCNEDFKVPSRITDIIVPLGCTINMCGGAVSFALLGLFCSQIFGIEISIVTYLVMIFSATIINMSAPGLPSGGIALGATYLSILGIPLTFIGFYSGIYRFLDMAYTTINVTGNITNNILINTSLERRKLR